MPNWARLHNIVLGRRAFSGDSALSSKRNAMGHSSTFTTRDTYLFPLAPCRGDLEPHAFFQVPLRHRKLKQDLSIYDTQTSLNLSSVHQYLRDRVFSPDCPIPPRSLAVISRRNRSTTKWRGPWSRLSTSGTRLGFRASSKLRRGCR